MKVRVIVASRYGATREIGERIAARLSEHGHDAAVRSAEEAGLDGADAVVLGSAIYAGRWMKPARELVEERAEELSGRPLWLFSSGPVGGAPKPEDAEPEAVVESFDTSALATAPCSRESSTTRSSSESTGWSPRPCTRRRATSAIGMRSTPGPTGSPAS